MIISKSNVLSVSNPTRAFTLWVRKNLIIDNPEYAKKVRMGFWTGNTPKKLYLYEDRAGVLYLPYGVLGDIPKELLEGAVIVDAFHAPTEVDFDCEVPLYDYQEIAVNQMVNAGSGILQSPAGSGKTQMGIAIAAKLGVKTLWLCHTLDLIKQSRDRAKQYMSESLLGTISEGKVEIGSGITFATVQTMSRLDLPAYKYEWDCILTDECHRVAGSPTAMTQYQKVLSNLSARHKYGLSATVHRADGMIKATFALIGNVAYTVPDEAVQDKIMKVGIKPISTGIGISDRCLNGDGTLNHAGLITYLTENRERNLLIANQIIKDYDKHILVLSDRVDHLMRLKGMVEDLCPGFMGWTAEIDGKSGKAYREQQLFLMRSGDNTVLFATYALAKEGLDIPCLDRLYMATPVKDYAVVTQAIGRIARTCEGKSDPICYDFVDNIGYLQKAYKTRCSTYKKNHCYFVKEGE